MTINPVVYEYVISEDTFQKDSVILKEGSKGNWIYIILEGRVKIKKKLSRGTVTIGLLKEGDILGEIAFLQMGQSLRSASAIADTNVVLGVIDTSRLTDDFGSISPQLRKLISSLMKRVRDMSNRVVELTDK